MEILTEEDCLGFFNHPHFKLFDLMQFKNKGVSFIPKNFIQTWQSNTEEARPSWGKMYLGKCSGIGLGSSVRYTGNATDMLVINRFNSIGGEVRFILDDGHNFNHLTTYNLSLLSIPELPRKTLGNIVINNDVWIGERATILGGVSVGNGCIIGANAMVTQRKILEPYGIYVGNPARLLKFRFDPKVIELLLAINWWTQPIDWIEQNSRFFQFDFNQDLAKSIELLQEMKSLVTASV